LTGVVSLILSVIFILGIPVWSPALIFVRSNAIFYLVVVVITIVLTTSNITNSVFIAKRRAGFVLTKNAIFSIIRLPLLLGMSIAFHAFGVVASWGLAIGITFIISLFWFLPKTIDGYRPLPTHDMSQIIKTRHYSINSYIASLFARAMSMLLPVLVLNILGVTHNAYFYVAWMIANLLFAISHAVSESLFAEGVHSQDRMRENVLRSIKFTFLLLIPAAIAIMALGKWLLLAFGQNYSSNALQLLLVLCISSLPVAIIHVYISLLRVKNRLKELIVIQAFIAISVIALSVLIMPMSGIIGIGYVWLGTQAVVALVLFFRLRGWIARNHHD
jgi:O-antigen/teichoic acid export membrane protein